MAKDINDLTSEIVQAVVNARAAVISQIPANKPQLLEHYLGDEALAQTFKVVFNGIRNANND